MTKCTYCLLVLLILYIFIPLEGAVAADSQLPEITSQGFSADQSQKGIIGKYPRLRVRIEVPQRLKQLTIRERSYEVDLAATRDKKNLHLFGLRQSPRSSPDVTLNLQNYINEKISSTGTYTFHLLVMDGTSNSAEKKILVDVHEPVRETEPAVDKEKRLLLTQPFSLQRIGSGPVKGGDLFGIAWKNKDSTNVAIKITPSENSNVHFSTVDKKVFDRVETIDQLMQSTADQEQTEAVVLVTSGNKAANAVFSIRDDDKMYLFKVMESSAYLSDFGTIVTLNGYYKYHVPAE